MGIYTYEVGLSKRELDTPALLVNLDAVEKNIQAMQGFCRKHKLDLRPHVKIHKATPAFAWMQMRAGAIGMTVAKLSEAEVLAAAGIRDILVANQVSGERKVRRLVNLAAYSDIIVAVDDYDNLQMISKMAEARGTWVGVVIEINIGNNRCGIEPSAALEMAERIKAFPNIKFRGVMGYDGHLAFAEDKEEKKRQSVICYEKLVGVKDALTSAGIPVEIVSGGGSATYLHAASVAGLTELQPGTYIFNDGAFYENGLKDFEIALSVLATVVSRPDRSGSRNMAVLDVGKKSFSLTYGLPRVKHPSGEITSMPQEHARLFIDPDDPLAPGDQVELYMQDANETFNLYDRVFAMRGDIVEAVWEIPGRGRAV